MDGREILQTRANDKIKSNIPNNVAIRMGRQTEMAFISISPVPG
jgi:hypothetical protein